MIKIPNSLKIFAAAILASLFLAVGAQAVNIYVYGDEEVKVVKDQEPLLGDGFNTLTEDPSIESLVDTDISFGGPNIDDILQYDGVAWENVPLADIGGGGGSSVWSTSTDGILYYNGSRDFVVGDTATTTDDNFQVIGGLYGDTITTPSFTINGETFTDLTGTGLSNVGGVLTSSGSMTYPGAGIALSTGSAWDTSITNNSANWNTAYGWGDHAGLYDVLGQATSTLGSHTTTYNHDNYDTAYSWGDWSGEGFITGVTWSGITGTQSDISLSGFTDDLSYLTSSDINTYSELNTIVADQTLAYGGGAFHDGFSDFVANEHIDWTGASAGTIHATNYVDNNTEYTGGDGLTLTGTDFDVDTTQNITTLSNLTSNGFVVTSGGNGTLGIDTSTYLTGNESITLSGDVSGTGATSITTTIGANKILESMLKSVNAPTDEYVLTYESTTGDFEWEVDQDTTYTAGGTLLDLTTGTFSLNEGTLTDTKLCTYESASGLVCNTNMIAYTGGTNLTLAGTTFNVDDAFLLNNGDTGTGVYDFGGATSLELPNNGTVDANGEITIDDTTGQLRYYGGSAQRVLSPAKQKCIVIEDLAAADDNMMFGSISDASTITNVWCQYSGTGTTVATISLEDGSGNAMTHTTPTCTALGTTPTKQSVTAANTLVAYESLAFDVDNAVSPETDTYTLCVDYTITAN